MELHAFDRVAAVTHAHEHPAFAPGRDLKLGRHALGTDGERVVAYRLDRVRQAGEHAAAVVRDAGDLAVLDLSRPFNDRAERLADALVTEADAEDRHLAGEAANKLHRDARLARRAGAGRDHDPLRRK